MRHLLFLIICIAISYIAFAQSPQSFQYQAVVRDVNGVALQNQSVGFQLSIISGTPTGTVEYIETHTATTNNFGIVTLIVGGGTTTDNFAGIGWGSAPHFLKVEADLGSGYLDMGTTQLLSVPYALHAETAGNADTLWNINGSDIYNSNQGNVGVGINNPVGRMVVQGSPTALATDPLFEVKNSFGQSVFVVWQDSVQVFINDEALQSNRGGFAVSGRNTSKAFTNNYLKITPDSSRIWTKDTLTGFSVENISGSNKTSYMKMTPDNYFIGHEAGKSITTGKYNSFIGYQSGYYNATGSKNYFIGYKSGFNNILGSNNIFIGDSVGYSNTTGKWNVFIGNQCGFFNTTGYSSVFIGDHAGNNNLTGHNNVFIGKNSGFSNSSGYSNTFVGENAGLNNTTGNYNSYYGFQAGKGNTTGSYNVGIGNYAGFFNSVGTNNVMIGGKAGYSLDSANYNILIGNYSGFSTNSGNSNTMIGYNTGYFNTSGENNIFLGKYAGYKNTISSNNTFIGTYSGYNNTIGKNNIFIGNGAGYSNQYSERDVFIGDSAGFSIIGSPSTGWPNSFWGNQNVFIGYKSGFNMTTGFWNIMIGDSAGYYSTTPTGNVFMGVSAGESNTTGKDNIFMGFWAGKKNDNGNRNVVIGTMGDDLGGNITENVFVGRDAGMTSSGSQNVFLGYSAGRNSYTDSNNVFLGWAAGVNNNGSGNLFIGHDCGANELGSNKLIIENQNFGITNSSQALIYGEFNNNILRFNANVGIGTTADPIEKLEINGNLKFSGGVFDIINGNNRNIIHGGWSGPWGDYTALSSSYDWLDAAEPGSIIASANFPLVVTAGNFGTQFSNTLMTVSNSGTVVMPYVYSSIVSATNRDLFVDNTGKIGYVSSSLRYKRNISDMEDVNWLYDLRPVNYSYKNDSTNRKLYGLIAEEVEKINPLFISYNDNGTVETVNYSNFISPIIKALQMQKKINDDQQTQINFLLKENENLKSDNNQFKQNTREINQLKAEIEQLKSLYNSSANSKQEIK